MKKINLTSVIDEFPVRREPIEPQRWWKGRAFGIAAKLERWDFYDPSDSVRNPPSIDPQYDNSRSDELMFILDMAENNIPKSWAV